MLLGYTKSLFVLLGYTYGYCLCVARLYKVTVYMLLGYTYGYCLCVARLYKVTVYMLLGCTKLLIMYIVCWYIDRLTNKMN